jgi:hypothetical protein
MSFETELQTILQRTEALEQRARRRALALTLLPALFAALLLGFTFYQVQQASQKLAATNRELDKRNQEVSALSQQSATLQIEMKEISSTLKDTRAELAVVTTEFDKSRAELQVIQGQLQISNTLLINAKQELDLKERELADTQAAVEDLRRQLKELQEANDMARALSGHAFPTSYDDTIKLLDSELFQISENLHRLFITLDEYRGMNWNPGGSNENEGFNSPSFASFLLGKFIKDFPVVLSQGELMRALPARQGAPQQGDLIFYSAGYCMFFFYDEARQPFVIGMTPRGVATLDYDFSKRIGIRAVFP